MTGDVTLLQYRIPYNDPDTVQLGSGKHLTIIDTDNTTLILGTSSFSLNYICHPFCVKTYYPLLNFVLIIMFCALLILITFVYLISPIVLASIRVNVRMVSTRYLLFHLVFMLHLSPTTYYRSDIVVVVIHLKNSCHSYVQLNFYLVCLN